LIVDFSLHPSFGSDSSSYYVWMWNYY
jgi:hypothetical protein